MKTKSRLRTIAILIGILSALLAAQGALGQTASLTTTFTHPTPTNNQFGHAVAALGSDRVVIGAYAYPGGTYIGQAYLFRTNGTLLATFTNPAPANTDSFGSEVVAVGSDRVCIGAIAYPNGAWVGRAYLFSTNGTWLTTFTNPTPLADDAFSHAIAAVGSDRVLISAYTDDTGATDAGAAYLFRTNGALLTTFTNPTPAEGDFFGYSVAAVGSDRVLIGARRDDTGATNAGAAYLFRTNGTLLTTITNPFPAEGDRFGYSVAAVGSDRLLIGAIGNSAGATEAGVVYLFSTNGTLLTTFTNPAPQESDFFGVAVAAVGSDRVLIGSDADDTGAINAGTAYLFSTDGTLLTTITNPTPAEEEYFASSLTAIGNDRVLIGASRDNTGGTEAGAAYLFAILPPSLTVSRTTTNTVAISWPSPSPGFTLQQNTSSISSVNWSNITIGIQDNTATKTHVVNPPTGSRYYRLFKP